jgi:hypothetical protein
MKDGGHPIPESSSTERCRIFLELAEKIAMEDPRKRKLSIVHENERAWQVMLGTPPPMSSRQSVFPTLEQALEEFILHWPRPWLHE